MRDFPSFYFSKFSKFLLWIGVSLIVGKRRLILPPPQTKEGSSVFFFSFLYGSILCSKTFKWWYFKKMVYLFLFFPTHAPGGNLTSVCAGVVENSTGKTVLLILCSTDIWIFLCFYYVAGYSYQLLEGEILSLYFLPR